MTERMTHPAVPAYVDRAALYDALAGLGFVIGGGDILQVKVDEGAVDVAVVVRYPDGQPMVNDEGQPAIHRIVVPITDAPARPAHLADPTPTAPAGTPLGFPVTVPTSVASGAAASVVLTGTPATWPTAPAERHG